MGTGQKQDLATSVFKKVLKTLAKITGSTEVLRRNTSA